MSRADRLIEAQLRAKAQKKPAKKKAAAEKPPPPPTLANVTQGAAPAAWPGYSRAPATAIGRSLWFSDFDPAKTTPRARAVGQRRRA